MSESKLEIPVWTTSQAMTGTTDRTLGSARYWTVLPWLLLAIGFPASLLLSAVVRESVEDIARLRFERNASDIKHVIEARIRSYADILHGLAALFTSQNSVSRVQFHRFVQSLDLKHRYPGFDVVNYAAYVLAPDRERFEEAVRRDTSLDPLGYPRFGIKPPEPRAEYYVLVYVEPMAGFEFAFGLDIGANPDVSDPHAVAAAHRSARDSGKLTASGRPIRIKTTSEYIGLAMRLPVYRGGMPVATVEQRRAAYVGSVGAGFNVANLMRGILDAETARYLRFRLYDVGFASDGYPSRSTRELLLFDSRQLADVPSTQSAAHDSDSEFTHILPMEIGGRIWEVQFNGRKDAIIGRVDALLPWITLAGGLLSSMLLFGMFYSLASSRGRAVAIANEITRELRESEAGLRDSTEQLQAMSRRLVDMQEFERRQFSRELHDRVGQNLTALSINLDILKTQLSTSGNEAFHSRLSDAAALLEATAGTIENVMSELRPPMLDDYGLLPALQWYANEFSSRTGIQVEVEGDEQMARVAQASEIALFRIAQEALNNVAKHAQANRVRITLAHLETRLVMTLADDGVGLEAAPAAGSRRRHGLGMVTMRERTQAVGGQFDIGAAPGRGTQVVVRVPC